MSRTLSVQCKYNTHNIVHGIVPKHTAKHLSSVHPAGEGGGGDIPSTFITPISGPQSRGEDGVYGKTHARTQYFAPVSVSPVI